MLYLNIQPAFLFAIPLLGSHVIRYCFVIETIPFDVAAGRYFGLLEEIKRHLLLLVWTSHQLHSIPNSYNINQTYQNPWVMEMEAQLNLQKMNVYS